MTGITLLYVSVLGIISQFVCVCIRVLVVFFEFGTYRQGIRTRFFSKGLTKSVGVKVTTETTIKTD